MKQGSLFGEEFDKKIDSEYTSKISTPIYEPKGNKPHILELIDKSKMDRLVNEIKASNLPEEEKKFLMRAACRHQVFNYEKIANYYAHSNKEMQELMEKSALVVIDFNKAYQLGYVKLAQDVANVYFDNYGE